MMSSSLHVVSRLHRPWRILFPIGIVLLFLGTHWPNLTLGPEVPASDKTIHLAVFAAITWLLWRARWTSSRIVTVLIAAIFSLLNEWSQGLPFINRHASILDAVANALGVLLAGLWLWALAPVGGIVNRRRLATMQYAWDRVFARWQSWLGFSLLGLPFLVAGLAAMHLLSPDHARKVLIGLMALAFMTGHGAVTLSARRSLDLVRRERRCMACDASVPLPGDAEALADPTFSGGTCVRCLCAHPCGTWADLGSPSFAAIRRAGGRSLAILGVGAAALFGLILMLPVVHAAIIGGGAAGGRLLVFLRVDRSMAQAVDLSLLVVLFAGAVRLYRSRIAAVMHDRADVCTACGHNLSGTPRTFGVGRCGECGQGFIDPAGERAS